MDIQNIFYLFGIIFMLLVFAMLVGTVVMLFMLKNRVVAMNRDIKHKFAALKKFGVTREEIAEDAGALIAEVNETRMHKK